VAAIRPEFVELSSASPEALGATVVAREFQGAFMRLSLSVEGFDRLLLADIGNAHAFADEGAQVAVRIAPEHVRLFAAS
jgi:ABC-type Fe3+/spermidine/putrescine transport system ATPase subunit